MSIARRKIAPPKDGHRRPLEEYAEDLEFELELASRFEPSEVLPAASLRHLVTESLDDEVAW